MLLLAGRGWRAPLVLLSDGLQALITRLPLSAIKPEAVRSLLKVAALAYPVCARPRLSMSAAQT